MRKTIISEKIKRALLKFGLTEKEISVYVVLLENKPISVQEIFRQSGVNRVTIYAAIDSLRRRGLIAESKNGKRRLFLAENPENLQDILECKKETMRKEEQSLNGLIIPALRAININQQNKPEMQFFEGAKGMSRVFDNYSLKYKSIIGCGSYEAARVAINWEDEAWYLNEIRRHRILYRAILKDTPLDRKISEKFRECFHVKFLETETSLMADIHVFGPYVALMSYETLGTTLIKDESIAQSIKMYLEFMWERL